jgi:hypothetical protein
MPLGHAPRDGRNASAIRCVWMHVSPGWLAASRRAGHMGRGQPEQARQHWATCSAWTRCGDPPPLFHATSPRISAAVQRCRVCFRGALGNGECAAPLPRSFIPQRYVQWLVTTPTMVLILSKMSDFTPAQVGLAADYAALAPGPTRSAPRPWLVVWQQLSISPSPRPIFSDCLRLPQTAAAVAADIAMVAGGFLAGFMPSPWSCEWQRAAVTAAPAAAAVEVNLRAAASTAAPAAAAAATV